MSLAHGAWKAIRDFAEARRQEAWKRTYKHDRKCIHCQRWYSSTGTWDGDPFRPCGVFEADVIECAGCGQATVWDCRGMMPVGSRDAAFIKRALSNPTGQSE